MSLGRVCHSGRRREENGNMFSHIIERSKEKKLRKAAKDGELSRVKVLLDEEVDATSLDNDGWSALHLASGSGHLDVVRELLSREACNVAMPGEYGKTALHLAASQGHLGIVSFLLSHETCDVNAVDHDGRTPLHFTWKADVVRMLLDHQADVNAVSTDGKTPLHVAAESISTDTVRALLNNDSCDANASDKDGMTPLHCASFLGRTDAVCLLLDHNADANALNTNGETALHCAAYKAESSAVRELLDRGLSSSHQNKDGYTPLALCLQMKWLRLKTDKYEMFWDVLETIYALMASGGTYDGRLEDLECVRHEFRDLAAIIAICVRHWTTEQRLKKRVLTAVPIEIFYRGSKAVMGHLIDFGIWDENDRAWHRKV